MKRFILNISTIQQGFIGYNLLPLKEKKYFIIYYPLPDFEGINICNISIKILTGYTNRKGELYTDHFTIGQLYQNDFVKKAAIIKHEIHKLLGYKNLETLQ